jgi:hypothetical protein
MGEPDRIDALRAAGTTLASQPEINDFGCCSAPLLETDHDVAWFDVPMNQLLLVDRSQTSSHLYRDFECQIYLEPTRLTTSSPESVRAYPEK